MTAPAPFLQVLELGETLLWQGRTDVTFPARSHDRARAPRRGRGIGGALRFGPRRVILPHAAHLRSPMRAPGKRRK